MRTKRTEIMYEASECLKMKKEILICTEMLFGVYMTWFFNHFHLCFVGSLKRKLPNNSPSLNLL